MSTELEPENGGDVTNPIAEHVENFISKKFVRAIIAGAILAVGHSFIAGGAWVGLTKTDEKNAADIVDLATIQKETATKLESITIEQTKMAEALNDVGDLRAEMRQMNNTMQAMRDDVVALKVRLERTGSGP